MAWIFYDDGEPEAEEYFTNYYWVGPRASHPQHKVKHQTVISFDPNTQPLNTQPLNTQKKLKENCTHAKSHS
jgi:hypothetical protein